MFVHGLYKFPSNPQSVKGNISTRERLHPKYQNDHNFSGISKWISTKYSNIQGFFRDWESPVQFGGPFQP